MAETIRIEIPIEAKDNTSAGVKSAQRNLQGLERDLQKMQEMMDRLMGHNKAVTIEAGVRDNATDRLADIEGHADQINHMSVHVDAEANDSASEVINSVSDAADGLDGTTATTDLEANDSASETIGAVADAAASLDGTSVNIDVTANDQASPVLSQIGEMAGGAKSAAGGIWGAVTAAAGFTGITMGVGNALQSFVNFEAGMSQVSAISGATGAQLDQLTAKAKEMGATTRFTATNAAEAFNYMAMAGWNTEQMLAGIEPVMNLAAASGLDLGRTSDIVTDALTAFGLKAEDTGMFTDVLATASARSNTNVDMLGESFKYVAPVAGALGYSIQDTAIALGIMANSGIKSSMAGTTLRRALSNLASPSEGVAAAMEKYNISLTDSQGNMKSLGDLMDNIRDSLGGLDEAEQAAAASTLFGTQAMAGMLSIINATDADYQSLTDSIYNAEGATSRMADTMLDNVQGSMYLLSSAFEAVQNTFGERVAPYLRSAIDGITAAMPSLESAINTVFDALESGKQKIEEGLEIHFGELELSAEQSEELAGKVLELYGISANIHIAETKFAEAEDLIGKAEEALKTSELLTWEVQSLKVDFNSVSGDLMSAADDLKGKLLESLEAKRAGSEEFINAIIPDTVQASSINSKISSWFTEDSLKIEGLNNTVKNLLQKAIDEGAESVETAAAISIMQNKMMEIANGAQAAELQGKMKWLSSKSPLAALNADSWASFVQDTGNLAYETMQANDSVYGQFFSQLETFRNNDPSRGALIDEIQGIIMAADQQSMTTGLTSWWTDLTNSLTSAYEEEMAGAEEGISAASSKFAADFDRTVRNETGRDINESLRDLALSVAGGRFENDYGGAREQLLDRFSQMLPTVDAMRTEIDRQLHTGNGEVSGALMSAYQQALELGASVGDEGATTGYVAQMIAQSFGNREELNSALEQAGIHPDAINQVLQDTFGESILSELDRAFASTFEDKNLGTLVDGLMESMTGKDIDWATVEGYLNEAGLSIKDYLADRGIDISDGTTKVTGEPEIDTSGLVSGATGNIQQIPDALQEAIDSSGSQWEVTADGLSITLGDAEVDGQSAAEKISEAIGVTTEELQGMQAEGTTLESGMTITIPTSSIGWEVEGDPGVDIPKVLDEAIVATGSEYEFTPQGLQIKIPEDIDVNDEGISTALQTIAESAGMESTEIEAGATVTISTDSLEVDTTAAEAALEENADVFSEPVETEASVDVNVELGEADPSPAKTDFDSRAQDTFNTPAQVNATVDVVNVSLGSVSGLEAAYAAFAAQAQAAFSTPVNVTGTVNVSTSANVGGAGAAQSAEGRFVDGPLLSWVGEDGPEYIIPVGDSRTSRGMDLWMQAGEALGAFDEDGIPGFAEGGVVGGSPSTDYSGYLSAGSGGSGGASPEVIISMSPNFTVNGSGDSRETAEEIRRMMLGMTDDIAAEMGRRLKEAYANMPR